jgi:methanogenic corrinoid protein MtbC1
LGEAEPFDDFSITDGMCSRCLPLFETDKIDFKRLQALRKYFSELRSKGNPNLNVEEQIEKGLALGISPMDLLIGVLQPALYQIGREYQKGIVSVAEEHAFSHFADRVLDKLRARLPSVPSSKLNALDCILMTASNNRHDLGIRILQYGLEQQGLSCLIAPENSNTDQLFELIQVRKPRLIGFSVALDEHIGEAVALKNALASVVPPEVRICFVLGGNIVMNYDDLGFDYIADPRSIEEFFSFAKSRLMESFRQRH